MREMIEDGIRRILLDQVTPGLLAAAGRGEWAKPLWNLLEEGGFTRALCSSAHGGSDASWSDVHPLLVASGLHCLPLPLPETLLACSLLEKAGIEPPEGPIGIADQPAGTPLSLQKSADQWRLDGELAHVPWGRHCKHLVAQVPHGGEMLVVLLASEGLEIRHNVNLAREPRDTFLLRDARPLRVSRSPLAQPDPIRVYGALLRAAQTAGATRRTLDQAVQYAGERVQFGRPLAKFQAVQQQIAMAVSEWPRSRRQRNTPSMPLKAATRHARSPLPRSLLPKPRARWPRSGTRCTARSATPPNIPCTTRPSASGPGAASSATYAGGRSGWAWPSAHGARIKPGTR